MWNDGGDFIQKKCELNHERASSVGAKLILRKHEHIRGSTMPPIERSTYVGIEINPVKKNSYNSMKSTETLSKVPSEDELYQLVVQFTKQSILLAYEAGEKLVAAFEVKPELRDRLIERGAPAWLINRLELCGHHLIDERLIYASGRPYQKLLAYQPSVQKTALDNGVEVLDPDEKERRIIPLDSLTQQQVNQVFDRNHIRDVAEQRTWLRAQKAKAPPAETVDWKVFKDRVVYHGLTIHKKLLLQWLSEMG